jgi:hypothetical protein
MKAIVANVLFGGIFGCLNWTNSACADTNIVGKPEPKTSTPEIISPTRLSPERSPIMPAIVNFVEYILTVDKSNDLNWGIEQDAGNFFRDNLDFEVNIANNQGLLGGKRFYTHQNNQDNLILGFQKTFWPSENNHQYWGVTTVEHWGKDSSQKLNISKLNYTKKAPVLSPGSSTLTFSGGGNQNLTNKDNSSREFEKFRGGITYHRGLIDEVTMGVGFVYEDLLMGFTQLTYDSDRLPVTTTLSLLAKDSQVNFHSHINFEPTKGFVLDYYYNDKTKQKFDVNWNVISGLTLTAQGNSQNKSLSTGIKVAINNQYLSFSANAALDSKNNLHWKFNSQIGPFQLTYNNREQQRTSELNINLVNSKTLGLNCAAFVKYQMREVKQNSEEFTVWGSKIQSTEKIGNNKPNWTFEVGYGSGSHGQGFIANSSIGLKHNLSLQLSYQEISAISDETKWKVQLSSK